LPGRGARGRPSLMPTRSAWRVLDSGRTRLCETAPRNGGRGGRRNGRPLPNSARSGLLKLSRCSANAQKRVAEQSRSASPPRRFAPPRANSEALIRRHSGDPMQGRARRAAPRPTDQSGVALPYRLLVARYETTCLASRRLTVAARTPTVFGRLHPALLLTYLAVPDSPVGSRSLWPHDADDQLDASLPRSGKTAGSRRRRFRVRLLNAAATKRSPSGSQVDRLYEETVPVSAVFPGRRSKVKRPLLGGITRSA
jgi:hypothetical protein